MVYRPEAVKERQMRSNRYLIGRIQIELNMPDDMLSPQNLKKFLTNERETGAVIYTLEFSDDIQSIESMLRVRKLEGSREVKRDNLHVFTTECGECRVINFHGAKMPYAVTCQKDEDHVQVWFDRGTEHMLIYDTVFLSALSLEKQMIRDAGLILHSAYMCREDQAILFSAPSETGKSTQADLWEKYRGTRTVNGDRSLLLRKEEGWYACGWPVCGSSEICYNESYPIRAVVMLKQAKENLAYRMKPLEAFRELMGQITINTWDIPFQMKVMDQLEILLREIPVYRLECNISEDAVKCLERAMLQDETGENRI